MEEWEEIGRSQDTHNSPQVGIHNERRGVHRMFFLNLNFFLACIESVVCEYKMF